MSGPSEEELPNPSDWFDVDEEDFENPVTRDMPDRHAGGRYGIEPDSAQEKADKEVVYDNLKDHGYFPLLQNEAEIRSQINSDSVTDFYRLLGTRLSQHPDKNLLEKAIHYFPITGLLMDYLYLEAHHAASGGIGSELNEEDVLNEYMKAFTKRGRSPFKPSIGFIDTQQRLAKEFNKQVRQNGDPTPVEAWECRIGAAKFVVPPINIKVSQQSRVGSLTGGALRQQTGPKFNSGHTETVVDMVLYFPNHSSIWGFDGDSTTIDFNRDGDTDSTVDTFLSSLRGLIAQFKYAPFLPIRNDYLNRAYGITGVVMHSMTISTLENYPFCVVVNLQLFKFNHKAYLPMIQDFNQAIHWGKYRQYMGRAAEKLNSIASEGFLVEKTKDKLTGTIGNWESLTGEELNELLKPEVVTEMEYTPSNNFNKARDWEDGRNFDLYFPARTPLKVFAPDISDFRFDAADVSTVRAEGENDPSGEKNQNALERVLEMLGLNVNTDYKDAYDAVANNTDSIKDLPRTEFENQRRLLREYLDALGAAVDVMTPAKLAEYKEFRYDRYRKSGKVLTAAVKEELDRQIDILWIDHIVNFYKETDFYQQYFEYAQWRDGKLMIDEWEVPMQKLFLDWSKVIVNGVSVTLANNIARLQLQMQEEPVHQHIGGQDSRIDVSFTVFGEADLIRLRRMFQHINGLARLEHAHGVLGFLGVKNVLTALSGIKYVMPLSFETETVNGYPHIYNVNMSFTDFDVMQQTREKLSSSQQKELVEAFSKRNPFLRIKQLWGAFNAYPDFPLSVRNKDGDIVGHLDPDFYFRSFQTFDDDVVYGVGRETLSIDDERSLMKGWDEEDDPKATDHEGDDFSPRKIQDTQLRKGQVETLPSHLKSHEHELITSFGALTEGPDTPIISMSRQGMSIGHVKSGTKEYTVTGATLSDDTPDATLNRSFIPNAELAPFSEYGRSHYDGSSDPNKQYELMMLDAQYRDISGRMVRAFPTYMLWLIDEGGNFAGVKLFDDFYGLQSIIDFSLVRSEDILGDTLVLRVSNIYSKLTSAYKKYIDPRSGADPDSEEINQGPEEVQLVDRLGNRQDNLNRGTDDRYVFEIENIRLRPGVRVHLRMGYSANPNSLQTVFNGTITQVEQGEIVTITAQSDAIELSPMINTTNKKGHSGKLDGGMFTNMWLSEPRDLMVRLLSMGSSTFKESVAHGLDGMIFSENRFGIRHFGQILYEPLSDAEEKRHEDRYNYIKSQLDQMVQADGFGNLLDESQDLVGELDVTGGLTLRSPMVRIMQSMYANFFRKRDYELFKRNIYPGNGLGIAQFLGGDMGDGGTLMASAMLEARRVPEGVGTNAAEVATARRVSELGENDQARNVQNVIDRAPDINNFNELTSVLSGRENHPFLKMWGIVADINDDDQQGLDEVSFRAQTYMKSVWDMFQLCAALLPNYIVAVRPFEDRSTIFYGKPHWLYTSGVIPLTTGIPSKNGPKIEEPDSHLRKLLSEAAALSSPLADLEKQLLAEAKLIQANPNATVAGVPWTSGDVTSLPLEINGKQLIPVRKGAVAIEMHLPTSSNLQTDIAQHKQLSELPLEQRHPFYMDRVGGGRGGYDGNNPYSSNGTIKEGDDPNAPGATTAFTPTLTPEEEQWYMNMRWPKDQSGVSYPKDWVGLRILVFNENTGKACVCTPGDYGPHSSTNLVAGISPDVAFVLGTKHGDANHWFGIVDPNTKLGPVEASDDLFNTNTTRPPSPSAADNRDKNAQEDQNISDAEREVGVDVADNISLIEDEETKEYLLNYDPKDHGGKTAAQWEFEGGYRDPNVPVWIDPASGLYQSNKDQNLSDAARLFYDKEYNEAAGDSAPQLIGGESYGGTSVKDAESIWDQFRRDFYSYKKTREIWEDVMSTAPKVDGEYSDEYIDAVTDFKRFLWQNAKRRAWLVVVTSKHVDRNAIPIPGLPLPDSGTNGTLGVIDDALGFLPDAVDIDIPGFGGGDDWDFGRTQELWAEYLRLLNLGATQSQIEAELQGWMDSHNTPGSRTDNLVEELASAVDSAFDATVGKLISAVGAGLTGLVNMLRVSMLQLGEGLDMVGSMQKQANMLNKVFNDSIYYSAGNPGTLLRMADNPFTREYGEPVIEIREPFQRMHFIDSFQHILGNQITENLNNVATVVTATSDGKYPVTVHFDKGAPSERQNEVVVETGLFWDNAKGDGIAGIIHPLLHPIETSRGMAKLVQGSSDEILSKRVALYHLKENLKDIYKGDIVILGNADIRPHDLLYIADVYSRIYGMVEVEQVVHHFTPDTGFITSITPNAVVTVNDPARWSMISWVWSWFNVKHTRDVVRHMMDIKSDKSSALYSSEGVSTSELAQSLEVPIKGHIQYTHGGSALVKDIASAAASGLLRGQGDPGAGQAALAASIGAPAAGIAAAGALAATGVGIPAAIAVAVGGAAIGDLIWDGWEYVRDNLLDQHGCYIQYLNKDGQAMDAGLSYAEGVAVGRYHSISLLPGVLGVRIPTKTRDGFERITANDLLSALGWKEIEINSLVKEASWWIANINSEILELAGRSPDEVSLEKPSVELVTVERIIDGDTFITTTGKSIRLNGIDTGELEYKDNPETSEDEADTVLNLARSRKAKTYLESRIPRGTVVAVRTNSTRPTDDFGRTLGVVFHNVPNGTGASQRSERLVELASQWPLIEWDSYMDDSRPYTINWEMVMTGHARVYIGEIARNNPDQGANLIKD